MNDEQVIKRRLVIDGDGTGDERRLNVLQKCLTKLCNTEEKPEDVTDNLDRMLIQLSQCKFSVRKSQRVAKMNQDELDNYLNLSRTITKQIEDEQQKIEETKKNLLEAKRIRRNKMEYNNLGKVINEQPDRKVSEDAVRAAESSLEAMKKERAEAVNRLENRRRQMYSLFLMLNQIKTYLNEPDSPDAPTEEMEIENDPTEAEMPVDDVSNNKSS